MVDTPSLGMVDDILCVQQCSEKSMEVNSVINAFIESKKLKLSSSKCHKIHVHGKKDKSEKCPILKVHDKIMEDSKQEKYLGDILDNSGKIRKTVEDRKNKGFAIAAEILAILSEVPLGKYKMEIGLQLRQAMLINGILFNSEAWHDIREEEVKLLESVDEYLIRSLIKAHSKTPLEFLYLEVGALPIRYIISTRRMIYLQTILKRDDDELTKKVYFAQKNDPSKGDFTELIKADFALIDETLDENAVEKSETQSYKKYIKSRMRNAALKYLNEKKKTHSKIKDIEYQELKTQEYLTSPLFNDEEASILFSLRSRYVDCKLNFRNKYKEEDLLCPWCMKEDDDQKHMLNCEVLNTHFSSSDVVDDKIMYEDIFDVAKKQKRVTGIFKALIEIRKKQLEANPSTSSQMLRNSEDLLNCIDYCSSGK